MRIAAATKKAIAYLLVVASLLSLCPVVFADENVSFQDGLIGYS